MVTADPSSPPVTIDHDSDCTHLREMYKRYMLIPSVSQWLLSRDTPTDFRAVRREASVLVSISSTSPPKVTPHDKCNIPFPASSDLMFLDHVEDGFAFGHIWGKLQSDSHPYAPLAARAGKSGWDRVQSRKFACDLTTSGTLETVEYAWFADNRAMVILSVIPCQPGQRIVRTSEILFFDSVERTDVPPQQPELTLLAHDRSLCTICGKEICCCPNAIGIDRSTPASCRILQERTLSGSNPVSRAIMVQSWEDRARIVSHGSKRGLLSIVYSVSVASNFSQITVRQAYVSKCENQESIGYRIKQHVTRLLSRMSPVASAAISQPASGIAAIPPFSSAQVCDITLAKEGSSQSPNRYTPKGGNWFDSSRQSILPPSREKLVRNCYTGKQGCCSRSTRATTLKVSRGTVQGTSCGRKKELDGVSEHTTSRKPSGGDHTLEKRRASESPAVLPNSSAPQDTRGENQGICLGSLCDPEKAGPECDCSAEKMQDSSLARILNSGRDHVVSDGVDMTCFMEPMFTSSTPESNAILHSMPSMNPTTLIASMTRQEHHGVDRLPRGPNPFDSQSPKSTKCETSETPLSPPLHPAPSVQAEPALKRPKTDSVVVPEPFGFGLEAGWQSSLEDRNKIHHVPAWNSGGGNIERPLSALGRALGVGRSHSPFALVSTLAKPPSPPAAPVSGHTLSLAKSGPAEFDFHSAFDTLPIPSLTEFPTKPEGQANVGPRINFVSGSGRQRQSPTGRSRNTGAATMEATTGGAVSCDVCGISFAKRSNKIRHIQTVHNRVKQFECDLCGAKFGLKADLGRHRFRIHESRAFRCDSCGKSFAEQGQLEHHVRVTHEEDSKPWECKTCRTRFGRKSSLTRHEQTVHQQTRFVCRFCNKSYSQRFDAVRHERRVHGVHNKVGSAGIKQLTRT